MTVMSLSFTLVNTYAPQSAKPASVAVCKSPPAQGDDSGCESKRPASRPNRLADAMMSALRELGFGSTTAPAAPATPPSTGAAAPASAATSTATPAAAAASAATPTEPASAAGSPASVESAVQQFAHALFSALRQSGGGHRSGDDDSRRAEGHHRHHHRRHGEGQGYGDMAQRLEALSQTFGSTPAAASAPAAPASATAAPGSSLSVTLSVDTSTPAAPSAASAPPAATTINVPAATQPKNPLLDAFTKLFNTLKPSTPSNGAAPATAPATDMAEKLRLFLHTLAQAVAPDSMGSVQRAQVGGLVNVTA